MHIINYIDYGNLECENTIQIFATVGCYYFYLEH